MNERIQQLLKESTYDVLGVKQIDQKQFAELLISECGKIADSSREGMVFPSVLMKEHFGVKNDRR
jgi:hypothetical protein